MERKLASIQRIKSLEPIEGADRIEKATMFDLGWQCVVAKGMEVGDAVVYFELDSVLPELPEFEFMRESHYRVKTKRLRKCLSQGLAIPVREVSGLWTGVLNEENETAPDGSKDIIQTEWGQDVTELLGVTKYEAPVPACLAGDVVGVRPSWVRKTNEYRIQSFPKLLDELAGKEVYISTKLDGTSMSVYYNSNLDEDDNPFGVCGRNMNFKESEKCSLWNVANRYNLKEKLPEFVVATYGQSAVGLVIQGELCGPGINKNRMGYKELDFYVFNVYSLDTGDFMGLSDMAYTCSQLGLKTVPIEEVVPFDFTIDELLEKAEGKYENTKNNKEGIVIRTTLPESSDVLGSRLLGCKCINNQYLLKDED